MLLFLLSNNTHARLLTCSLLLSDDTSLQAWGVLFVCAKTEGEGGGILCNFILLEGVLQTSLELLGHAHHTLPRHGIIERFHSELARNDLACLLVC